jgi:3-oxoacid CoA-transferase subunit A
MIKNWLITGDTHGYPSSRLKFIFGSTELSPQNTAIIILGDSGFNYYESIEDSIEKERASAFGCRIYCVRGNHEKRPDDAGAKLVWDDDVDGAVFMEEDFPQIRYFLDGGTYNINGYDTLVVGGAYSIDKDFRLQAGLKWFENEQLSMAERTMILQTVKNSHFNFVLTHTAPLSVEPSDLFINGIDQNKVDKTMENWLEELKNIITFDVWCFGHYHADRIEAPKFEQFFVSYDTIEDIMSRWLRFKIDKTFERELSCGPKMIEVINNVEV